MYSYPLNFSLFPSSDFQAQSIAISFFLPFPPSTLLIVIPVAKAITDRVYLFSPTPLHLLPTLDRVSALTDLFRYCAWWLAPPKAFLIAWAQADRSVGIFIPEAMNHCLGRAKSVAKECHGKIPVLRALPVSVLAVIMAIAIVNMLCWAGVGVALVGFPFPFLLFLPTGCWLGITEIRISISLLSSLRLYDY